MEHSTHYCIVGGGSGGHIIPGLTIAHNYKQKNPSAGILFFTSASELDKKIINSEKSIISHHVQLTITPPPLKKFWKFPLWMFQLLRAIIKSYSWLRKTNTREIMSTGGFVSVPVVLAARLLQLPITLYELNVEPGKATQFLSRFATTINITFNQTKRYFPHASCRLVEYPLRPHIKQLQPRPINHNEYKTLFVLGGSQGSVSLNNLVFNWITHETELKNLHIIHQTGSLDTRNWNEIYTNLNIKHMVFDFHDSLETLYPFVDFIICRAGAGTLFEIEYLNIPCLMIPLETSYTKHQMYNAQAMAEKHPQLFHVLSETMINSNPNSAYTIITNFISMANPVERRP